MPAPAIVLGDRIVGLCPNHLLIGPLGAPVPSPAPLPFTAPITMGTIPTVLIGGKPAAVLGASGLNSPPHVGLHGSDLFLPPAMEVGRILSGSPTVQFGGIPAASQTSVCTCCVVPGALVPTVPNVLIG
jgi:uncharacterized Zn-binding protein involved in type VI secretion